MDIVFRLFWILVVFCILFGIYELCKKAYYLAIGNILIPISLVIIYGSGIMNIPSTMQVDEITYFVQLLQQLYPFAVASFILHIMLIIIFIWDIKVIMESRKKRKIKKLST